MISKPGSKKPGGFHNRTPSLRHRWRQTSCAALTLTAQFPKGKRAIASGHTGQRHTFFGGINNLSRIRHLQSLLDKGHECQNRASYSPSSCMASICGPPTLGERRRCQIAQAITSHHLRQAAFRTKSIFLPLTSLTVGDQKTTIKKSLRGYRDAKRENCSVSALFRESYIWLFQLGWQYWASEGYKGDRPMRPRYSIPLFGGNLSRSGRRKVLAKPHSRSCG